MYKVAADDKGQWVLYEVAADWPVVGWFTEYEDAEFAREAFEKRAAERRQPPNDNDVGPDHVTGRA